MHGELGSSEGSVQAVMKCLSSETQKEKKKVLMSSSLVENLHYIYQNGDVC